MCITIGGESSNSTGEVLEDASRLDDAGGKVVAEQISWAEVRISIWPVRNVTEDSRSFTMAISWARRGVSAS